MTVEALIRGIFAVILSGTIAGAVFSRFDNEIGSELDNYGKQKYLPYLNPTLLPVFIITLLVIGIPIHGLTKSLEIVLPNIFSIFISISAYYLVLMLLMPFLRRHIASRTCALLWLLPNFLYITIQPAFELTEPLVILHLTQSALWVVLILWALGFFFVLIRAIVQHFSYRRSILKNAIPVEDPEVRDVWQQELELARIKKPKYKLILSNVVTTPLSIGFFNRSMRVVLPHRHYSREELVLILRHEIIHICRGDSMNKFFMIFCCAMNWFNPLMWIAMRKSADDLELSCDETVLLKADDKARSQYIDLILSTAGDGRGFTTCLSASISSLRYRLQNIVYTGKQCSGALVVAVLFFLLLMTCGYINFSYGDYSGNEIFYNQVGEYCTIDGLNTSLIDHNGFLVSNNEDALNSYIGNLHLRKISGNYSFSEYENNVLIFYNTESDSYALELKDQFLTIQVMGKSSIPDTYHVKTPIDWNYLASLLRTDYIQDKTTTFPPILDLVGGTFPICRGTVISYYKNGSEQPEESWWHVDPVTVYCDPSMEEIRLDFSHHCSDTYHIEIADLSGNLLQKISSDQFTEPHILPLSQENATYRILATFEDSVSSIEMEYTFTVLHEDLSMTESKK